MIILNHLANKDISINEANSTIPKFFMLKEKVELNDNFDVSLISNKIKSEFSSYHFNEIDGIKIINQTSWAILENLTQNQS